MESYTTNKHVGEIILAKIAVLAQTEAIKNPKRSESMWFLQTFI